MMAIAPSGGAANSNSMQVEQSGAGPEPAATFGQLVQRIVQSNSGKQRALKTAKPVDDSSPWSTYKERAESYAREGNFAQAETMWLKAISAASDLPDSDWRRVYGADRLAELLYGQGRMEEAEVFALKAYEASVRIYGDAHLNAVDALSFLSAIQANLKAYDEAVSGFSRCLSLLDQMPARDLIKRAMLLFNVAVVEHARGQFDKAEAAYVQCIQLRSSLFGPEHELTRRALEACSELAADRENHNQARRMVDQLLSS